MESPLKETAIDRSGTSNGATVKNDDNDQCADNDPSPLGAVNGSHAAVGATPRVVVTTTRIVRQDTTREEEKKEESETANMMMIMEKASSDNAAASSTMVDPMPIKRREKMPVADCDKLTPKTEYISKRPRRSATRQRKETDHDTRSPASKRPRRSQSSVQTYAEDDEKDKDAMSFDDKERDAVAPSRRKGPRKPAAAKSSKKSIKSQGATHVDSSLGAGHGQKWKSSNPAVQEFIDTRIRIDAMEKTNPDKKEQMQAYEEVLEKYSNEAEIIKAAKASGWIARRRRTLKLMQKCIQDCFHGDEDAFCTKVTGFLGVGESFKCLCQGYSRRPLTEHQIRLQASGKTPLPETDVKKISDDGVLMVGSHYERNLVVIPPPSDEEENVKLIRDVSRHFGNPMTRKGTTKQCRLGKDPSVRDIQSKRYEIFVHKASDKGSRFFDKHLAEAKLPASTADRLVEYAIRQTKRDPRIRDGGEYHYGNFSLILSYGECDPQTPHIDLLLPHFQFLLVLTDESPSTCFYDLDDEDEIRTVEDLERLWNENEKAVGGKFPSNLGQVMNGLVDAKNYLRDFGSVLHSTEKFRKTERYIPNVAAGTLLSLPGSVVHAGPATIDFRMVLFFSAAPMRLKDVEYNPDNQFSNVLLCGLFAQVCWRAHGMTNEDRLYLLRVMAHYIRNAACRRGWDRHFFTEAKFREVVFAMTDTKLSSKKLDQLLREKAVIEDLCHPHIQTLDLHGEFRLVSDTRLHIKDEMRRVNVYRRAGDNRALLYFPPRAGEDVEYWEGDEPGDHYTLSMNDGSAFDDEAERGITAFDGSNGVLKDNDGDVVEFVLAEEQEQEAETGGKPS